MCCRSRVTTDRTATAGSTAPPADDHEEVRDDAVWTVLAVLGIRSGFSWGFPYPGGPQDAESSREAEAIPQSPRGIAVRERRLPTPDRTRAGSHSVSIPRDLIEEVAHQVAELVAESLPHRPEPYLDVPAAAEYLSAPPSRIYELVERRAVAVQRDGRRLLFRRADLDAYLRRDEAR